ncbi:hypothetical protein ACQR1I_35515 [Bradyrhizobium sp. HKCCYLS2038]|uniref:hypothetical protein n=1 Tax=unclassified Bradyrhizobium TaxID=2631580 RepID=UPI003EBD5AB2
MTIYGGSHTNFDAGSFGAGAIAGTATIAGSLVAGVCNAIAQREAEWAAWEREQLVEGLTCEHLLRVHYQRRAAEAEAELSRMRDSFRAVTSTRAR